MFVSITAFLFAIYFFNKNISFSENYEARSEILDLWKNLKLNADYNETLSDIQQYNFEHLSINTSENVVFIETPLEFGAQNWVLMIEFKDRKIVALRFRTVDNLSIRPKGAPSDISL
jgi:hypothetical protein